MVPFTMSLRELQTTLARLCGPLDAYYDRVDLWVDSDRTVFDEKTQEKIRQSGADIDIHMRRMTCYETSMRQIIRLSQPTHETLRLVERRLNRRQHHYLISHVECAVDWIAASRLEAEQLLQLIEVHLIYSTGEGIYYDCVSEKDSRTIYFADRKTKKTIPVLYYTETKRDRGPRVHFEIRMVNTRACKDNGFTVLQNLLDTDISAFVKKKITFAAKPTKLQLGKILATQEGQPRTLSRSTYSRHCDNFLKEKLGVIPSAYANIPMQQLLHPLPPKIKESITGKNNKKCKNGKTHAIMIKRLFH